MLHYTAKIALSLGAHKCIVFIRSSMEQNYPAASPPKYGKSGDNTATALAIIHHHLHRITIMLPLCSFNTLTPFHPRRHSPSYYTPSPLYPRSIPALTIHLSIMLTIMLLLCTIPALTIHHLHHRLSIMLQLLCSFTALSPHSPSIIFIESCPAQHGGGGC